MWADLRVKMLGPTEPAEATCHAFRPPPLAKWPPPLLTALGHVSQVLGPTDPAEAPADSLRGGVLAKWKELGLSSAPNTGNNCVHASASPFEGFAERTNWLKGAYTPSTDPFGKLLIEAGIPEATLKAWSVDPQVVLPGEGGKKGSMFDQVEDMDVEACVAKCVEIFKAQPAEVS